jgi:hypothetical protein
MTSAGDDEKRLVSLISAQTEDYQRLASEMEAQEKALAQGDVEGLIEILRRKNSHVETITRRDREMRELADAGVAVGAEARERLEELKRVAAALLEREEKSLLKLNMLRSVAGAHALERAKARRAANVYGSAPKGSEPRFLDKSE